MSNVTIPQLPAATALTGSELFPLSQSGATSQVTLALIQTFAALLAAPAGAVQMFAQNTPPVGWLRADGSTVLRATYPLLFTALVKSSVVTMTIAGPGVITWTAHPLQANDPVKFSTTGALPTGFVAATTYYVVAASITTNTFQLAATPGGAAINTSGAQSGVHTAVSTFFGDGDGSTNFVLPDLRGEFIRGTDGTRGVDASRVMGSAQAADTAPHTHPLSSVLGIGGSPSAANPGVGGVYQQLTSTGSSGGVETRPRNIALLFCIKF